MADDLKTPLLDELEKGPWPSFVTDIKSLAGTVSYTHLTLPTKRIV